MPSRNKQPDRGCLYKLEVTNFKSYAGKLSIGPFKDFTCVIGPNGSGKSNLMDAVSFVMGVNTKDLRGAKVADFRSHSAKPGDPNTSVTMFYRSTSQSKEEESEGEIQFMRTITSSDASEYRIDGKKVPEKEYQAKLKSIGLLVKSRNFLVFQNEVEKIAQKSPKELTELIERVSGSEDHKAEYESLQEKKKEGSDKVVGLYRRKELVHKELKQCKEAVKEADLYQRYCDELKDTKTQKALFDAFHLERQMEIHAKSAEEGAAKMQDLDKGVSVLTKKLSGKGKEKANKQKEWADHDTKVVEVEKKIKSIQRSDLLKAETSIKSAKKDLEDAETEIKHATEKKKEISKSLKTDEVTLGKHEEELKKEEAGNKDKNIQLQGNQMSEYNKLKRSADAETYRAKIAFEKTQTAQQQDQRILSTTEDDVRRTQERIQDLQSKLASDSGDKESVKKQVETLRHTKQKLESDLQDLDLKHKSEAELRKKLEDKNVHFESQMQNLAHHMNQSQDADKNKRHVEKLKDTFSGVIGRVSDLCKVRQKAYELSMTVVMENHLDSIVVDNMATVQKCLEYLKEQKISAKTFLPLDTIKVKEPDQKLRELQDQKVKLALDLLEFEEPTRKAMLYACGDALVTDTLEQAKELAYSKNSNLRVKVVSKDGTVINKSGIMTGGDPSYFDSKLKNWNASDQEKKKEEYKKNFEELQACKKRVEQYSMDISNLHRQKTDVDHKLNVALKKKEDAEGYLKARTSEVEKLKKREQEVLQKIAEVKKDIEKRAKQLEQEQKELQKVNAKVYADFCKELGISDISEYEGGSLAELRQRAERVNNLNRVAEQLKSKTDKARKAITAHEQTIANKEEEKKTIADNLKEQERKIANSKAKLKGAMDEKQELIINRDEVKKQQDEIEGQIKEFQVVLKKQTDERDELARQSEQSEKCVERCKEDIQALLEQSKLDDLDLPRKNQRKGGDDEMEEDQDEDIQDSQQGQSQSQVVDNARQELRKINLDYSKLSRDQKKDLSDREQEKVRKDFNEKQNGISEKLQGMNPNMKAHEQLKEIQEHFNGLSNEWMEARKECDELSEQFEQVKKQRCDKFNKCFEHVTACIDQVYKELTIDPGQGGSVGGSAYLTLNSQDEPYTSGIKYDTIPPGKRFMDMTHLSGGEKTVAALALLFSINSYYPAPFIVLDEVDAALDARNVAKVTRFIQARREEQQCVIISLKERFYEKANGLVGICRNHATGHSNAFTLDLTLYDDSAVA